MLFGQEGNNLALILSCQSVEIKCEIRCGREFGRIFNMKPNLDPVFFSTWKHVLFLVCFTVFVALS